MSKAALKKFIKFEESADDKTVKAAVMTKMEDEAASAMEGDDKYNYDDAANRLEEMAKAYEDANFAKDDDGEEPHVAMRRYASKFRRMGAPKEGAEAMEGEDKDKEKKEDKEAFERSMAVSFAQRLSVKVTPDMSAKQIMDAISAQSVPSSELPKLIDARVQQALAESSRKQAAQVYETRARKLAEGLVTMEGEQKEAFIRFAADPKSFDAAKEIVRIQNPTFDIEQGAQMDTTVLMSRMTSAGAPLALNAAAARSHQPSAGSDSRIVSMEVLGQGGRALVTGEKLASAKKELADSTDPVLMAKVDRELEPGMKGTQFESYGRYLAAERILKKEQPALFEAAKTDNIRSF